MNTVMVATNERGVQQLYTKKFILEVRRVLGFEKWMRWSGYAKLEEYYMDGTLKDWVAKQV